MPHPIITSSREIRRLSRRLAESAVVAVDLEADSMFHFKEKVCLIQMATGQESVVIDPLQADDLSALAPVFDDASIRKVFHGADYDIRSLYRDFSFNVRNLFDTQVAATFLGLSETGLNAVVDRYLGVQLDKKYQKKNWSQRPLPDEMVAYAAGDVAYLLQLADILRRELASLGRLDWVEEECALLSRVRPADDDGLPLFVKCRGAGRLDRRSLAILEQLLALRVDIARKKDRPLFKVFSNPSLLTIATARPRSRKRLESTGALSSRQIAGYGARILDAVHRGLALPADRLPVYPKTRAPRLPAAVPERIRALRTWRDAEAERLTLDPSIVCTKAQMTAVAMADPSDLPALNGIAELKQWQKREFGNAILDVLAAHRSARRRKKKR